MGRRYTLMARILSGRADANISCSDLLTLLASMGFQHRQEGSHHVLQKTGIPDRLTLQSDGAKAKRYQVRQVRNLIRKHRSDRHE